MSKRVAVLGAAVLACACGWCAQEVVRISPEKAAQLKRLEPLSPHQIQIFLDSGQLTVKQAQLVLASLTSAGSLQIPDANIGAEAAESEIPAAPTAPTAPTAPAAPAAPVAPAAPPAPAGVPRHPDGSPDVSAWLRQSDRELAVTAGAEERRRLEDLIRRYRRAGPGETARIKQDLRAAGPAAVPLAAAQYGDPVDFDLAADLLSALAGPHNSRAAGYFAEIHRRMLHTGDPVLIPYRTHAGGLILRRRSGDEAPRERWFSSEELRELIVEMERQISACPGVRAVGYLADVYLARYAPDEAPLRDSGRDRDRMIRACGAELKHFDNDEPETWASCLTPLERALCAERLLPLLRHADGKLRKIARDPLLVCLGGSDGKLADRLDEASEDWAAFERWYLPRREQLLAARP